MLRIPPVPDHRQVIRLRRAALLLLTLALLGFSARPPAARQDLERARPALQNGVFHEAAGRLALPAGRLLGRSDLWEQAGRHALAGGDPQAAIDYLEQAPPPGLTGQGWLDLGDAYQQTGNLPAAVQAWERALATGGPAPVLYERLLQAHQTMDDSAGVIADLQGLVSWQPANAQRHYQLGLLLAARQPEAALAYLARAAELDPGLAGPAGELRRSIISARVSDDRAYALLAAGRTLADLGDWELAAEAFQQATLERPDYAEAWAFLGEARQHGEGVTASRTAGLPELQQALALDPRSLAAHLFLALYWQRQADYAQALEALAAALEIDPHNPLLLVEYGDTQAMQGDLPAGLQAHRQAAALRPNDVTYLNYLASFSLKYEYQLRQVALPAARQAVILAPQSPAALDMMAQVLIKLDDTVTAERFLSRSLQADPDYAPAHLHLGLIYLLRGENTRAYREFDLARTLSPGSPTAGQSQRFLQTYFP